LGAQGLAGGLVFGEGKYKIPTTPPWLLLLQYRKVSVDKAIFISSKPCPRDSDVSDLDYGFGTEKVVLLKKLLYKIFQGSGPVRNKRYEWRTIE
jgi:hypothetical protein